MIILTGANRDKPTDDTGKVRTDTKFTFGSVIRRTEAKAKQLGYVTDVYDLGNLGFGEKFNVDDESFVKLGYYKKEVVKGYKSKSLFKPQLVKHCITKHQATTIYLDGDALLCSDISEIDTDDYDVGVTLRHPSELEGEWHKDHFEIAKYVNAGVIFFRNTANTAKFLDAWDVLTDEVGNDQMALNQLSCPDYYPEIGSVIELNGVRVKYFPGEIYNYYHFKELSSSNAKIMHFKGVVRDLYPYNTVTRLYCNFAAFLRNLKKSLRTK